MGVAVSIPGGHHFIRRGQHGDELPDAYSQAGIDLKPADAADASPLQ